MKHSIRFARTYEDLFTSNPLVSQPYTNKWRHTYNDWFMVPQERYSIEPPEHKQATLDIPGGNGFLDYSEALTGYPLYKNREGTMTFKIMNDRVPNERSPFVSQGPFELLWNNIYRDICMFLHGKNAYMLLEDDPEWYYYGRFTVGRYDASDGKMSQIKIDYNLQPFKNMSRVPIASLDKGTWYWDVIPLTDRPENNDIPLFIPNRVDLNVESNEYTEIKIGILGEQPVIPKFIFSNTGEMNEGEPVNPLYVRYRNDALKIKAFERKLVVNQGLGTFVDEQIVFSNVLNSQTLYLPDSVTERDFCLEVKGQGTITIDYEIGVI